MWAKLQFNTCKHSRGWLIFVVWDHPSFCIPLKVFYKFPSYHQRGLKWIITFNAIKGSFKKVMAWYAGNSTIKRVSVKRGQCTSSTIVVTTTTITIVVIMVTICPHAILPCISLHRWSLQTKHLSGVYFEGVDIDFMVRFTCNPHMIVKLPRLLLSSFGYVYIAIDPVSMAHTIKIIILMHYSKAYFLVECSLSDLFISF